MNGPMGELTAGSLTSHHAMTRLRERAVLTRAVCDELDAHDGQDPDGVARAAMYLLLRWMKANLPATREREMVPNDGLDEMVVPPEGQHLMDEIRAGAGLAYDLWMQGTANSSEMYDDQLSINRSLVRWRNFRARRPRTVTPRGHWPKAPRERRSLQDAVEWDYRVARRDYGTGSGVSSFGIIEAYYDALGNIVAYAWAEPWGDTLDELMEDLRIMAIPGLGVVDESHLPPDAELWRRDSIHMPRTKRLKE